MNLTGEVTVSTKPTEYVDESASFNGVTSVSPSLSRPGRRISETRLTLDPLPSHFFFLEKEKKMLPLGWGKCGKIEDDTEDKGVSLFTFFFLLTMVTANVAMSNHFFSYQLNG